MQSSSAQRVPLIAAGDVWIVLAILAVLFFPFGLGSSGPARYAGPDDAAPFATRAGATLGVSPKWHAALNAETDGWSAPGYGGIAKATVVVTTFSDKDPARPLDAFAEQTIGDLAAAAGATDLNVAQIGEIAVVGGRTGVRLRYTWTAPGGIREEGLAIVVADGALGTMARLFGTDGNIDDIVLRLNEPYLRTITPPRR